MLTISTYPYIPLRENPAESAEMGTQILFGEPYEVLEIKDRWAHVRTIMDNYEGYIDAKLVANLSQADIDRFTGANPITIVSAPFIKIAMNEDAPLYLPLGSRLPLDTDKAPYEFKFNNHTYTLIDKPTENLDVISLAKQFLNTPYLWGGRTIGGIDCSGFSQTVYRAFNVFLPRNASAQAKIGTEVSDFNDIQPGDLAFFSHGESNRVTHVGICIDSQSIIHASGSVRIDTLTPEGIYNNERNMQTHRLLCIRRPQKHIDNIISVFQQTMPKAESELNFNNNFELLVAVMLSAQCTDKRVNMVTPALFKAYPDAESMAKATDKEILEYISSISYPNSKASHLAEMARKLTNDFKGIVPDNMDDLQSLPGVGRKTANVIMAVAFNAAAMPVDTHVYRVARRLGLSKDSHTPVETEAQLSALFPPELLSTAHHWLLLHGRYTCTARNPKCSECPLLSYCQGIN